jgi:hypothetical protein
MFVASAARAKKSCDARPSIDPGLLSYVAADGAAPYAQANVNALLHRFLGCDTLNAATTLEELNGYFIPMNFLADFFDSEQGGWAINRLVNRLVGRAGELTAPSAGSSRCSKSIHLLTCLLPAIVVRPTTSWDAGEDAFGVHQRHVPAIACSGERLLIDCEGY